VNTIDTMRKMDSTNSDANNLLTEAKIKLLKNTIQVGYLLNTFNDFPPFGPWDYAWLEYIRNFNVCPVGAKVTFGSVYGLPVGYRRGTQLALDAFPKFTPGTYADVEVAHSNDFAVFPQWQITLDVYQKLGAGFEASLGGIYMHFIDVVDVPATPPQDVWILDPSIGYYSGEHWLFTYKPYFTYKGGNIYVVHTVQLRHLFKNPDTWVSLYGSYGTTPFVDYYFPSPVPTTVKFVGIDYQTRLPHNFLIWPMISYEYVEWYPPTSSWTNMFYFQLILTKRF
jgi:YaiO family outer membrane protein